MENPEKCKNPKNEKTKKCKKLMFLSGTLPAGAFFCMKKNISPSKSHFFRQNFTFPVKIETFPDKIETFPDKIETFHSKK